MELFCPEFFAKPEFTPDSFSVLPVSELRESRLFEELEKSVFESDLVELGCLFPSPRPKFLFVSAFFCNDDTCAAALAPDEATGLCLAM